MSPRAESLPYRAYYVWDASTRWFHWINALAVFGLIVTGVFILFDGEFGFSPEGKLTLKAVHVTFGYVMAINLLWRFIWGFFGNRHARWSAILPGGPGYATALRTYIASLRSGAPDQYVGHNPLGRIAVSLLLLLLLAQAITGLVLAGTDLYWAPFGTYFAEWVAAPGVAPSAVPPGVGPGATDLIDKTSYDAMRAFRALFKQTHEVVFYTLFVIIILHIAGVVITELREGGSIVSAMFTGRKILSRTPADAP